MGRRRGGGGGERRVPLAGRDKLFVLSRGRDTEIHRESGTMSRRPLAEFIIGRLSPFFLFSIETDENQPSSTFFFFFFLIARV